MKLYEIKEDYVNLLDAIEEGEIPEEAITDTLAAVEGELKDKADNIACMIKQLEYEIGNLKSEEDTLAKRRRSREKAVKNMKEYLTVNLLEAGIDKIETARSKITFRRSESVDVADIDTLIEYSKLHPAVVKIKSEPNKTVIKSLIQLGEAVPGCTIETKQNIQIK